jgi:hypothetical protein
MCYRVVNYRIRVQVLVYGYSKPDLVGFEYKKSISNWDRVGFG